MRLFRYVIVLMTVFSFLNINGRAQQALFEIKGKVADESGGQPLEFATVSLKRMRDSSLVSGTITGSNGEFRLKDLPPGGYQMEVAFIGYERHYQRVILKPQGTPPLTELGIIKLNVSAKMLEGAEITAEKSFVISNIDKKTFNTEQLAVTAGGNVKDVLENVPSVEVDGDGNVSLRGNQNVTILIDGRPSGMTGSGGKSLLESIPASAIEAVEVITNPSAKYDPDGISGIINIVTKKNKLQGFTGNVGINTSFEDRYGANLSLGYRHGKWNVFGNYGFNRNVRKFEGDSYSEIYSGDTTYFYEQREDGTDKGYNHNVKAGFDFNMNDHNTISASALYNSGPENGKEYLFYHDYNPIMMIDTIYKRFSDGEEDRYNMDFDLNYRHFFKEKGRLFSLLGTASFDESKSENRYEQLGYFDALTPDYSSSEREREFNKNDNSIYTVSSDYEHPVGDDKKIETGYKGTFREFDTDLRFEDYNTASGIYENDTTRTNRFIFSDQLHALYLQYRQSIKKFGYQIGLRSEYAATEGELVGNDSIYEKDYFSLFPSAFVTYKPDEKSQIKATYSRRINRPGRWQVNPFPNYDDPKFIRKGNPYLNPEYTDSYELEYNRFIGKFSFTATGYARITHDYIQRHRVVYSDGSAVVTFENLTSSRNYGVELILNGSPFKWWNLTLSTNIYRNEVDATNLESDLSSASLAASGRIFTTFKLPYKTELQLTYFYRAPVDVPQGTMKDMQMATIALSKKVLKDKGVISARLSDPFDVQRFGFEFENESSMQNFTRKRQSRILTLSFTYRFGELRDRDNVRQRRDNQQGEDMDF